MTAPVAIFSRSAPFEPVIIIAKDVIEIERVIARNIPINIKLYD